MNTEEFKYLKMYIQDTGYKVMLNEEQIQNVDDNNIEADNTVAHYEDIRSSDISVLQHVRKWRIGE